MATYAITGGAGFIGSHLGDALLAAGHRVRVLDDFSTGRVANLSPRCAVIRGDVCDRALLERLMSGVDGCFHLAAIASVARGNEDWTGTSRVNLAGTVAVLDVSRALGGVPVVYASSAAVYGTLSGVAAESAVPSPRTAYGADKLASELHARVGALVHGVPSVGFRFFNVYGPRQDPASPYSGVISIFAKAIAAGQGVMVHGDGRQTRDFVFVADVVAHLMAGMRVIQASGGCHVLNVCTEAETSILELAAAISDLCGQPRTVRHGPARDGDISRSVGSAALARATLGVQAQTALHDGLRATICGMNAMVAHEPA